MRISPGFVVWLLVVLGMSCGKNSPRGMAETMIGTYTGTWHRYGTNLTGSYDSTYAGTCDVRQGSKKKAILVNNIYFELYKGEEEYETGSSALRITLGEPPTILLRSASTPQGGVDTLEFYGTQNP